MAIHTDSERQTQERNVCMKCACALTVYTMLISLVAFAIGAVAITKSAPVYAFPYCIGGSMIAGFFTCVSSFVQYRHYIIYSNNRDAVTKEDVQQWSRQLCLLCPCVCTSLILGLVFSGIWGMIQASAEKEDIYENPFYEAFAQTNFNYSVASFVLVLTLSVLQMILYCVCYRFKASYRFEHRRNQPSTTNAQASGRTVPRFDAQCPTSTSQSKINTARNNPSEKGRSENFSIPIPELYYGRPTSTSQSEINTARNNPSEQGRSEIFSIPIPELYHGGQDSTNQSGSY